MDCQKGLPQVPPLNLTLQFSDLNDDEMIKNELIFLKSKFHSKKIIDWHYMQFELNSNSNLIELRCNWSDFKFDNLKKMGCNLV